MEVMVVLCGIPGHVPVSVPPLRLAFLQQMLPQGMTLVSG
jgi:hypothetical protein